MDGAGVHDGSKMRAIGTKSEGFKRGSAELDSKSGSGASGGNPEVGASDVAQNAQEGFGGNVGGDRDGGKGDALAAEDEAGNRLGAGHVVVGCDQIEMLDVLLFEGGDEAGEVDDGDGGAVVEVQALGGDMGGRRAGSV